MKYLSDIIMSKKMDEFLEKIDLLCFEYKYEIKPSILDGLYNTIEIKGDDEVKNVLFFDGDGMGK